MPRRRALPPLDRMRALTSLLGDPQDSIPSVHVTGTNGKGSTSAMVTALLMAKGLSVGTYTSPNLHVVAERIARNGEPIDDESLTAVLTELALLEPLLPERPTRFDLLTAAAFVVVRHRSGRLHGDRGGPRRDVGHHQRDPRRRGRADQRQLRPHRRPGPHPRGDRRRQGGDHRAGQPGRGGRDGPRARRHRRVPGRRGRGGVGLGGRAGLRDRVQPGRRRWAPGDAVDARGALRGCARPVARGPPGGQRRRGPGGRRGLLRRPAGPRRRRRGVGRRSACPGASRCWAGARCCWSTARTTRRAWRRWATR